MAIFVGHTRFSLYIPNSTAWVVSSQGETGEYRENLFSEHRLDPRARVFLEYSLPQIDLAIKSHNVLHIVSFSPELPEKYRAMLIAASKKYSWLMLDEQIDRVTTVDTFDVVQRLRKSKFEESTIFATYRLDDDDLLPTSYFDRMSSFVNASNVGSYVSFGLGITAFQFEDKFSYPRLVKERMFTAGLLSVCSTTPDGAIVRPNSYRTHAHADAAAPVIVDSRSVGFFWNRNAQQDTAQKHSSDDTAINLLQLFLSKLPRVDMEGPLLDEFPLLSGKYQKIKKYEVHQSLDGLSEFTADFKSDVSELDVEVSMDNSEGIRKNNALIELVITGSDNDALKANDVANLKRFGIYKLNKGHDLFFVYVPTGAVGPTVENVSICVPSGCVLKKATVAPWGDSGGLKLLNVQFSVYVD